MKHKFLTRKKHYGFSLLEVMVAIAVIALLASLTIGLSNSIMRRAEERQTEDTLRLLKVSLKEWEIEKGNNMTFEDFAYVGNCDGCYFDVWNDGLLSRPTFGLSGVSNDVMQQSMEARMGYLITSLREVESSDNILLEISHDAFENGIPIDAWGTPIGVIFPGQYYSGSGETLAFSEDESGDLTIRDQSEDGLGSCVNKRPIFVSAGADRLWGYRFQAAEGPGNDEDARELWQASLDNIYSYDPFVVEKAR